MSFRESFLLTKERLVSRLRSFGVSNASASMGWASLLSLKSNTSISLDVPLNLVYSDDFLITGVLQTTTYTRIPGATVKLKVGSTVVDTGVTDNSGMFSFTRTPVAVGNHSFQVIFEGDNLNNACESVVVTREVGKETTVLSVDNIPVQHYGDSFSVSGVLSDDDGVPVVNKQITIGVMLISGTEKQVTCNTDSLGRFSQVIPVYTRNIMRGENFRVHVQSMSDENFTGCSVFIDVDFYTSVFSLTSDKDIISAYDDEFAVLTANLSDTGGQGISDESVVFYTGDFDSYTPDDGYLDVTGVSKVIVLDSSHRWCGFKTQEVNGMYVRFHYDKCAGYGEISSSRGLVGYFYSPVLCVDDNVVTFVDSQGNEQTLDCTALSRNWEVTGDGLISVFSDDDVLGWGFTDSDGNCVEYYYGKGAGDLNIKAKCMNVLERYPIVDYTYINNNVYSTSSSTLNIPLPPTFELEYVYHPSVNMSTPYLDIGDSSNNRMLVGQYNMSGINGVITYLGTSTNYPYSENSLWNQDNKVVFRYDGVNYSYSLNDGTPMIISDKGVTLTKLIHIESGGSSSNYLKDIKIKPL